MACHVACFPEAGLQPSLVGLPCTKLLTNHSSGLLAACCCAQQWEFVLSAPPSTHPVSTLCSPTALHVQAKADMDGRQDEEHSLKVGIKAKKREVAQLQRQLEEQQGEVEELAAQARELAAADADVAAEFAQSTQQQVGVLCFRCAAAAARAALATAAPGKSSRRNKHAVAAGVLRPHAATQANCRPC